MSFFSKFSQSITESTLNSSIINLAPSGVFTGQTDNTLDVNAIQVSLMTDQNATVYVEQSPDTTPTGPHWDLVDSFRYFAEQNFGVTVQAISSYFRVRVENTGGVTTNYFRLQSILCPIVEALPRALTQFGSLKSAIVENVASICLFNSKTNLTGSQVWIGEFEESINQSAIQVIAKFDKDFTLYIDQSQNTTTPDISDSWECLANTGVSYSVASIAPYYRLRLTNKSTSSATGQMTSAATAIFNPLPRKLDADGHLETVIEHIHGKMGHDVIVSPMGGLKTTSTIRLIGSSFVGGTLDTNFWQFTHTNTGNSTQANGSLTLNSNTGTNANGGELVNSLRIARYVAAYPNYYRGNIRLPAVTTASSGYVNTRRFGAFDANNGYFFVAVQTNPATVPTLSIVCRKTASDSNIINSGSFVGEYGPSFALDNNVHTYEIFWTNKNAYFFIDDVLLHTFSGLTATLVDTLSLKIGLENVNSGNNTAINTLVVRSSTINRLGNAETRPIWKYYAGVLAATVIKFGPGTLHKVIVNKAGTSVTLNDDVVTTGISNTICIIDTNKTTGGIGVYNYDLDFYNGLVVTIAGSGSDCTIIYE